MKLFPVYLFLPFFLIQCSGKTPSDLGVRENGQLKECPPTPNCVSSFTSATDKEHSIAPLSYIAPLSEEHSRLKKVIQALPRTKIVEEKHTYIRAEFTSFLMRYVDDVEFLFDEKVKLIQVRSASRLGRSDLGVNRKRIELLRSELQKARD